MLCVTSVKVILSGKCEHCCVGQKQPEHGSSVDNVTPETSPVVEHAVVQDEEDEASTSNPVAAVTQTAASFQTLAAEHCLPVPATPNNTPFGRLITSATLQLMGNSPPTLLSVGYLHPQPSPTTLFSLRHPPPTLLLFSGSLSPKPPLQHSFQQITHPNNILCVGHPSQQISFQWDTHLNNLLIIHTVLWLISDISDDCWLFLPCIKTNFCPSRS